MYFCFSENVLVVPKTTHMFGDSLGGFMRLTYRCIYG